MKKSIPLVFLLLFIFSCGTSNYKITNRFKGNYKIDTLGIHGRNLKTNGYYYYEEKIHKANFHKPISIKGDFIYAVRPILLDSVGNFSISDRFIGMYNSIYTNKRNNNYASSKKNLEESLKKDYKLPTTGSFSIKNNKIRIQYYLNGPESSKSKQSFREYTGIVLNDSTFVLTEYLDFRFKKITMLHRTYHFQKFN
tara:strand:- start:442 stop:1029 length:588 start_codon:yes stop_codon:yes gene_type:complete